MHPKPHNPGFLALVNDAKSRVRQIGIDEYKKMAASNRPPLLVDVREDSEWNAGHAAGAVHLGKGVIERDIESTVAEKDKQLVLYCGGGFRSALAAEAIQKMGYTNAMSLDGGWRAIQDAGLPIERWPPAGAG